jgi:hypothetical protein
MGSEDFDDGSIDEDLVAGDDHAHISARQCKNVVLRSNLSRLLTYSRVQKDFRETF